MPDQATHSVTPYFGGRRYFIELSGAFLVYVLVLMVTIVRVEAAEPGLEKITLALAPVLPLGLVGWAIKRQYDRSDELQRRMVIEAFALGALLFLIVMMIWGFAENAGAPRLPMIWIAPALMGLWGFCTPIVLRKYR